MNHALISLTAEPVPLILWGSFQGYSSRIYDALIQMFPNHRIAMISNNLFEVIRAIEAGLGIGYLPDYVAKQYPTLQKIQGAGDLPYQEVWMVIREEAQRRRCVRAFIDHLINTIENPLTDEL